VQRAAALSDIVEGNSPERSRGAQKRLRVQPAAPTGLRCSTNVR